MKVGILTFHDANNYGAVLQAYALKEGLKSINKNSNVEIINYKMPYIIRRYRLISINRNNLLKSVLATIVYIKSRTISKFKFNKFRKKYMNISSDIYYNSKQIGGYDIYIVGSDQVWNPDIIGNDEVPFLSFCNENAKKISYAASIGKNDLSYSEIESIKQNINNFDAISVREERAVEILKPLTDKNITRVLDPTFIVDKRVWYDLVVKEEKSSEKYILLYMVFINEEAFKIADIISKKMGLPVWYINDSYKKTKYGFKYIRNVGPIDFVRLFKNASFIVTSSFHGTAFSIIFKKNFFTVPHKKTSSRMVDLLGLLKLEDRLVNSCEHLDYYCDYEIDYSIPDKILDVEKQKSLDFLNKALN